ncbi:hypothetical protein [Chromobacterium piscinae]|uniref:hypothetical protein n=1 Tax=Chromobacterium piscinae TaxID=686831 RepID=UPI00320AC871
MSDVRYSSTKSGSSTTGALPIPDHKIEYLGSYQVNQKHELDSPLVKSLDALKAVAARFSTDVISDASVRVSYQSNIGRMALAVLEKVNAGEMTAKEGMEFASEMRNKIMMEHRAVTSAQGLAAAEAYKKTGKTQAELFDKYSNELFGKKFETLSAKDKSKVYYAIVESSSRSSKDFNTKIRKLKVMGRVGWIVTATLAAHAIATAENKKKEAIKQGGIIGGGMIGGAGAGLLVSPICGPGAPFCATAVVLVGGLVGGFAASSAADYYDDELEEFTKWEIK